MQVQCIELLIWWSMRVLSEMQFVSIVKATDSLHPLDFEDAFNVA